MYFPTICVDNFFNDPETVRNFALSLDYQKSSTGKWPGSRTKSLDQISHDYFQSFCEKIFLLNYDLKRYDNLQWSVETYFQLIQPLEYGKINTGWIHKDHNLFAGIVYLSPNIDVNCGTSIFRSKNKFSRPINIKEKNEMYLNFNQDNLDFYQNKLQENNSLFEETIRFNNIYNRLLAYDGSQYHGVNNFYNTENLEPRLTQVFFVKSLSADYFPIPASKQIHI